MIDEECCIRSIASGSEEALKQLYLIYGDRMYNTIISYTNNAEDAEEVLQDVFITVFHTASQFQFDSSVSTWIYRIAVNKSLDLLRKRNSQKRKGLFTSLYKKDTVEIQFELSDFDHPGVEMENKEDARLIFRAIDTLNENQKTAFILTHIEGLPQKEVGEIMNLTRQSVNSLVQRAKVKLKIELEKFYPHRGNK